MTAERWTIGDAALAVGVSADTLRYYEREGLIGPIGRDRRGQRAYTASDLDWVRVVTCLRDAGLGIADSRRFTELLRAPDAPRERVEFLLARRAELAERLESLTRALALLDEKIERYGRTLAQPPAADRHRNEHGQQHQRPTA